MTDFAETLSAYLDGELDAAGKAVVEARLATDPDAKAELDRLKKANAIARTAFEAQLDTPLNFDLIKKIKETTLPEPINAARRPIWGSMAAGLAVLAIGCLGG